jgi:hypothetical protein
MKHLKPLSASILIVSALLLSAVNNASPDENKTPQIQSNSRQHQQNGEAIAPSPKQASPDKSGASSYPGTYNYSGGAKYNGPPESALAKVAYVASIISAVFLTLFTGMLVWINSKLIDITAEMQKATADAAKANAQSAKATELALNIQRAYVFAESLRLEDSEQRQTVMPLAVTNASPYLQTVTVRQKWLWFELRNRGHGIAIIEAIRVRACIVRWFDGKWIWESTKTERLLISRRVLAPSDAVLQGTVIPNTVVPPVFDLLDRFVVLGSIRYRDVFKRPYKSTFAYYYKPSSLLGPDPGLFYLGAERHNRIIEIA